MLTRNVTLIMNNQSDHEKYDSKNPIAQKMIAGFMNSITDLVSEVPGSIQSVTECGCGQGHVNQLLERLLPHANIKGFDIDLPDLTIAKQNQIKPETTLYQKSIYDISSNESADLVVCCEVLEHLENPELALQKMAALNAPYYLFSVPNEPLWRVLNFLRGKYMRQWGNTPDHRNHWSTRGFKAFVGKELQVTKTLRPLPWSMVLAQPKQP